MLLFDLILELEGGWMDVDGLRKMLLNRHAPVRMANVICAINMQYAECCNLNLCGFDGRRCWQALFLLLDIRMPLLICLLLLGSHRCISRQGPTVTTLRR